MAGPERTFIDKVHNQVDPEWNLFKQCNTGIIGGNGTPDYYYEAMRWYIWIEYKAIGGKLPETICLIDHKKDYALTPWQRRWLNRAHRNETRAAAVLGSLEGALIFTNGSWEEPVTRAWAQEYGRIVNPRHVADFAAGFDDCRVIE